MKYDVKVKKLNENATIPTYGTEFSAGADLYACLKETVIINPHETVLIPTGISLELPLGYAGLIYARSGIATKRGLAPANKVGVIDCDYRGEIMVALHNHSNEVQAVENKERIAQLSITPYVTADVILTEKLSQTVRGEGGFGSTGKR